MPKIEGEHTDSVLIRVKVVSTFLLDNQEYLEPKRNVELYKIVMEKCGCEETTARRYIAEARKEIKTLYSKNVDKKIKKALRDRESLIRELKKGADKRTLLAALKDRDELLGLYEQKIKQSGDVTVRNIDMNKFTEHGLERLKKGDKIEEVLTDPKSVKQDAN